MPLQKAVLVWFVWSVSWQEIKQQITNFPICCNPDFIRWKKAPLVFALIHNFIRTIATGKGLWFRFETKTHTEDIASGFF